MAFGNARIMVDASNFIALKCELADKIMANAFGYDELIQTVTSDCGAVEMEGYTDEGQEIFNDLYEQVERILNDYGLYQSD